MTRQTIIRSARLFALTAGLCAASVGCKEEKKDLAPQAAELEQEKAPEVNTAQGFTIDSAATEVSFMMDAELEKITGKAPESAEGELTVDLADISKTTGLAKVDLLDLSLYQQKREDAEGEFSEPEKNETQNEHMRVWLQISEDAPEDMREKFRYLEFKITKVEADETNVLKMKGNERKVDVQVSGTVRLHGRVTEHTFPAQAVFQFEGDTPKGLVVTTKEPIGISLEKHDVHPRKTFDVLADKTLSALGAKVAKVAEVSLELHATPK